MIKKIISIVAFIPGSEEFVTVEEVRKAILQTINEDLTDFELAGKMSVGRHCFKLLTEITMEEYRKVY